MFFTWFCPDYIGFPWFSTPNVLVSSWTRHPGETSWSGTVFFRCGSSWAVLSCGPRSCGTSADARGMRRTDMDRPRNAEEWWSWLDVATLGDSQTLPTSNMLKTHEANEIWGLSDKSWWTMPRPEGWPLTICIHLYTIFGKDADTIVSTCRSLSLVWYGSWLANEALGCPEFQLALKLLWTKARPTSLTQKQQLINILIYIYV